MSPEFESSDDHFVLPDTLASWPWKRAINPHYAAVKQESTDWFHSFRAFEGKGQTAFDLCDFPLLAALAYPSHDKGTEEEHLRTSTGTMILAFVFDEYSDVENANNVKKQVDIMMDALRNPSKPRPKGEIVLGEITRQFWDRAVKTASPTSQKHFVKLFDRYASSVVQQALDRDEGNIRSIEEYLSLRYDTAGTEISFVMIELDMNIPDEIFSSPTLLEIRECVTYMIILTNDMYSYNVEQAQGDSHNIIAILRNELKVDIQGAMKWVEEYYYQIVDRCLRAYARMPWKEDTHPQVWGYVNGLMNWARANDSWSFEGHRYFGERGSEIHESRVVQLLCKNTSSD